MVHLPTFTHKNQLNGVKHTIHGSFALLYIYICTFDTSIYMYIYYVHVYLQYILHVPRADYPGHVRVWEEGASS